MEVTLLLLLVKHFDVSIELFCLLQLLINRLVSLVVQELPESLFDLFGIAVPLLTNLLNLVVHLQRSYITGWILLKLLAPYLGIVEHELTVFLGAYVISRLTEVFLLLGAEYYFFFEIHSKLKRLIGCLKS